jgi:twitching motility protein PilI
MSKHRNSKNNKGQNAGKGGKQARPAKPGKGVAPVVAETPAEMSSMELPGEDLSAMLVSDEAADESPAGFGDTQAESDAQVAEEGSAAAFDPVAEEMAAVEQFAAEEQMLESHAHHEATPVETADVDQDANESRDPEPARRPLDEFEDASAALARAIHLDPADVREATQIESIPLFDASAMNFDGSDPVAPSWDHMGAQSPDAPLTDPSGVAAGDAVPEAGAGGKGKKDRKLRLNKLQKHARGAPEPEAETAAPEPEPVPIPRAPREPRIAAFAKLTEYQSLSLAHIPGLPEESDVPGHWRGVGFGIGGRRLVSGFDEVVEIMRLPQITHVPGTQPWMLGVANVRGTLLPVVDLKQFLEGERTVMHEGQRVLVVRQAGGNVAVLIDQLFGQRSFNDSQKAELTAQGDNRYGHFVKQVYRVGDNDWGVFSMSMLTRTPEFRQAAA